MAHEATESPKPAGLPLSVVSIIDVGRLTRELEAIDNELLEQDLRKQQLTMPSVSRLMQQTIEMNHLDLLKEADRATLKKLLLTVHDKSPVLHISFSADPTPAFTESIMAWLRREVDPLVLITVGLQPNIAAGCVVRSTNHYFDFSLRHNFLNKRDLLIDALHGKKQEQVPETAQAPAQAQVPEVPKEPPA